MAEHDSRTAIWLAVISAISAIAVAIAAGMFNVVQTRITAHATESSQAKNVDSAENPSNRAAVNQTNTGTEPQNTPPPPREISKLSVKERHSSESGSGAPIPTNQPNPNAPVCDATSDHVKVHLVMDTTMRGSDLYVDDQPCRQNVAYEENLVITIKRGSHHLTLKRGDKSCETDVVAPQTNNSPVILTCQ